MNIPFTTKAMLKQLKQSALVRTYIPMTYTPGLPIISIVNDELCMTVPYLKYKITGEIDKTLVYPIRYTVTVTVPEGTIVGFSDLAYNEKMGHVDFNKAIGTFRHEAIKGLDREAYNAMRDRLYDEYDKVVAHLIGGAPYTQNDEKTMRSLFTTLVEPSEVPFYLAVDQKFAQKYIIKHQ